VLLKSFFVIPTNITEVSNTFLNTSETTITTKRDFYFSIYFKSDLVNDGDKNVIIFSYQTN